MIIHIELRDVYPKMGLNRKYIGDGYPLCSDIAKGSLFEKGSTYRLTTKLVPEIYIHPIDLFTDPMAKRTQTVHKNFFLMNSETIF